MNAIADLSNLSLIMIALYVLHGCWATSIAQKEAKVYTPLSVTCAIVVWVNGNFHLFLGVSAIMMAISHVMAKRWMSADSYELYQAHPFVTQAVALVVGAGLFGLFQFIR